MDVVTTLGALLEPVNATYGWYNANNSNTHVTFCMLHDVPMYYSDDIETGIVYTVQVDIWSKDDLEALQIKNQIRNILKTSDFGYTDGADLYEDDVKIYHKALVYQILDMQE